MLHTLTSGSGKLQDDITNLEQENSLLRRRIAELEKQADAPPSIDAHPLMTWCCDAKGACLHCNPAWREFTGLSLQDSLGNGWHELLHPEDREQFLTNYQDKCTNGWRFDLECRMREHDGKFRPVNVSCLFHNSGGGAPGCVCSGHVIEDNEPSDPSMRTAIRHLQILMDNLPLGVSLLTPDLTVLMVNKTLMGMLGNPVEDLLGKKCFTCMERRDHICSHCPGMLSMRENRPTQAILRKHRQDGSEFNVLVRAIPIYEDGRNAGFIEIIEDCSERERMERERLPLAELVENAEHIAVFKDTDLRYVTVNRAYLNLTGHESVNNILGKTDEELFEGISTPEQIREYMEYDREALQLEKGRALTCEETTLDDDGGILTYLTKKFPVFDQDDKLLGVATLTTDITQRKRAEEQLTRANQQLQAFFENIPGYINVVDKNFNVVGVSKGLLDIVGIADKSLVIGKKCHEVFQGNPHLCEQCSLPKSYAEKRMVVRFSTPEEEQRANMSLKIYTAPILDELGEIIGGMEYLADISDLRQLERDLVAARDVAEAASKAKSEFLATMSHEIRTPLNGVLGMLQLLTETPLANEQMDYVHTAQASSTALLAVINDILDLSKLEAGKVEIMEHPFSLEQTLENVLEAFRCQVQEKDIQIGFDISPDIPRSLIGDSGRLRQVLFNLVGNSVKFTNQGRVELSVSNLPPRQGEDSLNLLFMVSDTGQGIPEQFLDILFEPFTQGDSSYARKHSGTGLGLTIVKKLVELMQGRISVESEEGKGTTFYFTIPMKPADKPGEIPEDGFVVQEYLSARRLRVLLAEDNDVNQFVTKRILEQWGHEVVAVMSGMEVLQKLTEQSFDVIVMDIQMPDMDGLEATRRIRESTDGSLPREIPIIAMTAHAMPEDSELFLKSGMNGCLIKPVEMNDLFMMLENTTKV